MSLSQQLWDASADLVARAHAHRFVRSLADGSLPGALFAGYLAQDACFLVGFARAYALALSRAPATSDVLELADLLGGVREELRLHQGYAAGWGVDLAATVPGEATLRYLDLLLATAAVGDLGTTAAAMLPCLRLYAELGQALAPGSGPYRAWVDTYADPAFAALAQRLAALVDAPGTNPAAARVVHRRALQAELAFFDSALQG